MVEEFGTTVILPGDPRWFIPASEARIITAAAVVNANAFVLAMVLDGEIYSSAEAYSRFYRFDHGKWLCIEVETSITDMLVVERLVDPPDELVVLGVDGDVRYVTQETRSEYILGPETQMVGTTVLRRFDDIFYAAGLVGQCFRGYNGTWRHDDEGMLDAAPTFPRMRPVDVGCTIDIDDLVMLPNGDQYACGSLATARPALFWRPGGTKKWHWLGSGVDDPVYDQMVFRGMLVDDDGMVWITTDLGVLFKGTAARGFGVATETAFSATHPGSKLRFRQIVHYQGAIIARSNEGPYRLRRDGGWEALPKMPPREGRPRAKPIAAGGKLEVYGDLLWSLSANAGRFDGQTWTRFPMPSTLAP